MTYPCPYGDTDGAATQARGSSRSPLRRIPHTLWVDNTHHRPIYDRRALDILRTAGYMDTRPLALLGREIVFGLDRVTLDLEIEDRGGEIDYGISVAGVNVENVEEIGGVLEENGVDVI